MTGQRICTCRFCGRDDLTPQGHQSHETHCDENPNPGVPYAQQKDLGILEEEAHEPDDDPNPYQSVSDDSSGGLPDVETLSSEKNAQDAVADGGTRECPICGHDEVLDAGEAKSAYIDAVDQPNPKAVLGYELADHACQNPECAALWGERYDEPLPMSVVLDA